MDALLAGYNPKKIPTAAEKPKASAMAHMLTTNGHPVISANMKANNSPNNAPIIPPMKDNITASIIN
ncbi:hypothetical protein D3C78_1695480 [compost metagenome]